MLDVEMVYCDKCKEKLKSFGDISFEVFDFICVNYMKGDPVEISTKYNVVDVIYPLIQIINFLEKKGYLITKETDHKDILMVKPSGVKSYGDDYFKICRFCIHDPIIWD